LTNYGQLSFIYSRIIKGVVMINKFDEL